MEGPLSMTRDGGTSGERGGVMKWRHVAVTACVPAAADDLKLLLRLPIKEHDRRSLALMVKVLCRLPAQYREPHRWLARELFSRLLGVQCVSAVLCQCPTSVMIIGGSVARWLIQWQETRIVTPQEAAVEADFATTFDGLLGLEPFWESRNWRLEEARLRRLEEARLKRRGGAVVTR
jgi:hypothetical protein